MTQSSLVQGSGCGSGGKAIAFDTRGLQFDSSHQQNFTEHLFVYFFIINCIEKTKINKKRPGMDHFFKKSLLVQFVKAGNSRPNFNPFNAFYNT